MLTQELFMPEPIYIFLSAHIANAAFRKHALEKGVQHFYEKPMNPKTLVELKKLLALPPL